MNITKRNRGGVKSVVCISVFLATLFSFEQLTLAKRTEGLVSSVDTVKSRIELTSIQSAVAVNDNKDDQSASTWVSYDINTDWPVGVTDPKVLEQKWISVDAVQESPDGAWKAISVDEMKSVPAVATTQVA